MFVAIETTAFGWAPAAPAIGALPQAVDRVIPNTFEVVLTAEGFEPAQITVVPGQSIAIRNGAGVPRSISSGDATIASGPVGPGQTFVLALPTPRTVTVSDDAVPAHEASITVGLLALTGDPNSSANAAIADQDAPVRPVMIHPTLGLEVTRNRILLAFTPQATVDQANAALDAAELTIVGGNRDGQLLVVDLADPGGTGIAHMQAALDVLRSSPGVRTAAFDVSLDPNTALPRPADPDPGLADNSVYRWDAMVLDDDTIRGAGINYGLEAARFPQAWNWLDSIRRQMTSGAGSATIVLDGAFDTSHPDLANTRLHRLCTAGGRCTDNLTGLDSAGGVISEHGTAVAGTIGAVFDRGPADSRTSVGTVGGDPMSSIELVPFFVDEVRDASGTVSLGSFVAVLDLILDNKSIYPQLRVINLSAGFAFLLDGDDGVALFEHLHGTSTCGPGDDDDTTAPAVDRVACTPDTHDGYLTEFRAAAELVRPLASRLAANNVLLVVAAGNDSEDFCATRPRVDVLAECTNHASISTTNTDPFGYLTSIWAPGVPPWINVEANVTTFATMTRSPFSNVDGQVSAASTVLAPFVDEFGVASYQKISGTSFAAPLTSAAAGLLSALEPSWLNVRNALVGRGPIDLTNSDTPRLDAFSALLGLPADRGIDALLDVNDASLDGNRRVIYDDRGQPTSADTALGSAQLGTSWSVPDGRIDMRDFRRYRDARLDFCFGLPGCPSSEQIALDGSPVHPKRDTNFDRCFGYVLVPGCTNVDSAFSRLDFNGDGTLLDREFPILLTSTGQPAARGAGTRMTDLDVFQTRFGQGPGADTEGWTADDLDRLMVSADVEVRLDTLWAAGAEAAQITVHTVLESTPLMTVTPRGIGDARIITVPLSIFDPVTNSDLVQVRVAAIFPAGNRAETFLSPPMPAKAGQDLVVVACANQLSVSASNPAPTPGGVSLISATLDDCTGRAVPNESVDFEISEGPDGSTISIVSALTDSDGVARTVFSYPANVNSAARVTARAYVAIDGGERLERFVDLGPAADVVVHYRFRQTILDYVRASTNDWGANEDDCDGPTDLGTSPSTCFFSTQTIRTDRRGFIYDAEGTVVGFFPYETTLGEIERRGTITPAGNGTAVVDEEVRSGQRSLSTSPNAIDYAGITLLTDVGEWTPDDPTFVVTRAYESPIVVAGQSTANGFADLPAVQVGSIDFGITPERLQVNNLRDYVDGYAINQAASTIEPGIPILPPGTNPDLPIPNLYSSLQQIPTDVALLPRLDSSSLLWDWIPGAPLQFVGNGDGTYAPMSWCGTHEQLFDNGASPGYWNDTDPSIETIDPADPNNVLAGPYRNPDEQRPVRAAGDRAAPRHAGSVRSQFEFVAIVTPAGAPEPTLDFPICEPTESEVVFGWQPSQPVEGERVDFFEISNYGHNQAEEWWFGDPRSVSPAPGSAQFSDDGIYPVQLTVTDAGLTRRVSDLAVVTVKNAPPTLELLPATGERRIDIRIDDPGLIDRQQLEVRLASPTPGWPSGGIITYSSPPLDPTTNVGQSGPWTVPIYLPTNLTPGVYFVTLSVHDKDGGKATQSFSLAVNPPAPGPSGFGFRSVEQVGTPTPAAVVPAFVVDTTAPTTGVPVTVRNATRSAGVPVAATVTAGDGRGSVSVAAGGTVALSYSSAGTRRLTAGGSMSSIVAQVDLTVAGSPIVADVVNEGDVTAAQGADAAVIARVTDSSSIPLAGLTVRFTLGAGSAEAVTDGAGRARAGLPVVGATGVRDLVVEVVPDGPSVTVPFTVTPNAVPTADAGGPYTVGNGSGLDLAGAGNDADAGEQQQLTFAWDLDGDGEFDDALTASPSLTAAEVRTVICGGECGDDAVATIRLRVTDPKGGRAISTTTVTIVRDFGLTINPGAATLVPNANVSFIVSVVSTNDFTGPVALTAPSLPDGVTATFEPSTVTPNGTSLLTLRAGPSFSPQDFDVLVRGASGSLVRETGADLSLEFGLIPECFGSIYGRITDRTTGAGIAGIPILGTLTATDGTYTATNLPLDPGNAPRSVSITSLGSAYYPLLPAAAARIACGVVTTLDIALVTRRYGAVQGVVTGVDLRGNPLGPLSGVTFQLNRTTGADGRYSITNLNLGADNAPINATTTFSKPGFHPVSGVVRIEGDSTSTFDPVMRQVCTASARVRILDQNTGRAVPAARVDLGAGTQNYTADSNGIVIVPDIALAAPDNGPSTHTVRAFTPDGVTPSGTNSKGVVVGSCGAQAPLDIAIPFPRRVEAVVDILVLDELGAPIPGATGRIETTNAPAPTNADGRIRVTHLLGFDVPPSKSVSVTAFATDYISPQAVMTTITEGQPNAVTVTLTRRRTGSVAGMVRDAATGAPLAGVEVNGIATGSDGRYRLDDITLQGINEPRQLTLGANDNRTPRVYWNSPIRTVTVRADEVTQVPDLLMLKVCDPARVRGRVVNALTREPIEGASVQVGSNTALTDADGRFVIVGIVVGRDNADLQATVIASKPGFLSAQKNVRLSCGADVVVDFGSEGDGVGTIVGTVTDAGGAPVDLAVVTTGFGGWTQTNAAGQYTIADVPVGPGGAARTWSVRVVPPAATNLGAADGSVDVSAGATATVDFVLATRANDPPTVPSYTLTLGQGTTAITLAGVDPTGDALTYAVVTAPEHGTLSGSAPALTYTPDVGYVGEDRIEYTANDGVNTSNIGVVTLIVRGPNMAPTARITGPTVVDEGSDADLSGATSSDPDGTITAYDWDLDGDGQYDDRTGSSAQVRLDDDGSVTIGLRVTDDGAETGFAEATVEFRNVAPLIALDAVQVDGGLVTITGFVDDPGLEDTFTGTIDLGDGDGARPLTGDELDGATLFVEHTYSDGAFIVTIEICDDDDGCASASVDVEVGAVSPLPTAVIDAPDNVPEGSSADVSGAASHDAGGAVVAWDWEFDGDDLYDDAAGVAIQIPCVDDGVISLGLRVTDLDGDIGTTSRAITCENVVPTVAALPDVGLESGGIYDAAGSFADPGADEWTATVEWGEGGGPEPLALNGRDFVLSHRFDNAGTFVVQVEVCDDDGGCGTQTAAVTVADVAPAEADLSVMIETSSDEIAQGTGVVWSVTILNAGPGASGPVTVAVELDDGLEFIGGRESLAQGLLRLPAPSGWECEVPAAATASGAVDGLCISVQGVPSGGSLSLGLDLLARGTGVLAGRLTVSAIGADPNPADNQLTRTVRVLAAVNATTSTTTTSVPSTPSLPPTTNQPTTEPGTAPTTLPWVGGDLPVTGRSPHRTLIVGLALIALGSMLLGRRRRWT